MKWLIPGLVMIAFGAALAFRDPKPSEPMPVLCKAPDPKHIDGLCWDGKTTRNLAKGYGVVELKNGVYLVGYDE